MIEGSTKGDEYYTPKWVTDPLGPFDLDPSAGPIRKIAKRNYRINKGEDGLKLPWFGMVWCNPPYSGDNKLKWAHKMIAHENGFLLLPSSPDTYWFNLVAMSAGTILWLGRRVNFRGPSAKSGNRGPSVILPFGKEARRRLLNSNLPGTYTQTLINSSALNWKYQKQFREPNLFNQVQK